MVDSESTYKMKFGKHKGKLLKDVPDEYLLYISDFTNLDSELRKYINDNIDAIKANINKGKWYNKVE